MLLKKHQAHRATRGDGAPSRWKRAAPHQTLAAKSRGAVDMYRATSRVGAR